jgi:hypothetical protein
MANDSYGVKRIQQALSLTHGAGVTTVSNTGVKLNGELWQVNTLTPAAVDGSATATINIVDVDGLTVYTKASLAANTKTADKLTSPVMLSGLYTVQVVFSGNQTTTDSITNVSLIIKSV